VALPRVFLIIAMSDSRWGRERPEVDTGDLSEA